MKNVTENKELTIDLNRSTMIYEIRLLPFNSHPRCLLQLLRNN